MPSIPLILAFCAIGTAGSSGLLARRRIHIRQEDRTPDLSWTPITLDLADVRIR
ncbi:hypothetical protein [Micromonospora sp. DT231]|uniref:hypothetical protein n=1 Tax=Micromonospora sp. DT231 TaxID=3416526 RepID=UPI003CF87DAB